MADEKILPRDLVENPEPTTQSLAILDDGTNVFATSIEDIGNRIGAVRSVQAGLGISVDDTDPLNPVVTATDSGGDMFSAIYDPQGISNDAFARENHTGEQPISATSGLQDSLDSRYTKSETDNLPAILYANKQFEEFGAVGDFDPISREGTDNSEAWAAALVWMNENRQPVFGGGHYYVPSAPGVIVDPALQSIPQVDYEYIDFRARSGEECVLYASRAATSERPQTVVTRPILKAERSDRSGTFRLLGVKLDGGISGSADFGGSPGSGDWASVSSMLEVRGYERVEIDIEATRFLQNWDTRTPENGNGLRRGATLFWGNKYVVGKATLRAPTFREGICGGNNTYTDIGFSFFGHSTMTDTEGNVSSPLNWTNYSTAVDDGRELKVSLDDWEGAWTGSAMNLFIPGHILIEGNGRLIRGGHDGVNPTTGNNNQSAGGTFGKGIDIGAEIAQGPTGSVTINDLQLVRMFQYSLLVNRAAGTRIAKLRTHNLQITDTWRGPIISFVDEWNGDCSVRKVVQYDPSDDRMGVGYTLSDILRGAVRLHADGSETGQYQAPNSTSPIASGTKYSRRALSVERCKADFSIHLISHDWRVGHVYYVVSNTTDEAALPCGNILINATSSSYTTVIDGPFFRFGSAYALANLFLSSLSTYNGQPLVNSPLLTINASKAFGVQTLRTGLSRSDVAQGSMLAEWEVWNGDGSSSQAGVRGAMRWFADDVNGRGASLSILTAYQGGALTERLRLLDAGVLDFADDTAAAVGGVPINGVYRTGSILKVRVS